MVGSEVASASALITMPRLCDSPRGLRSMACQLIKRKTNPGFVDRDPGAAFRFARQDRAAITEADDGMAAVRGRACVFRRDSWPDENRARSGRKRRCTFNPPPGSAAAARAYLRHSRQSVTSEELVRPRARLAAPMAKTRRHCAKSVR